jgi:Flp pilus assembly protein TadG
VALRLARPFRRFVDDDGGAITVEAVLWLPFFFGILMLITDASLAFHAKAQAFRAVEEGNRAYAVGAVDDVDDVEARVRQALASYSPAAGDVETRLADDGRLVSTEVQLKSANVMLFDLSAIFGTFRITVRAQHYVEQG